MAFTNIGSIVVDVSQRILNPFPIVDLKRNKGFMFFLDTTPIATVPDYVYFLVIPIFSLNGLAYERPKLTKWFPKGGRFLFKVSTLEKFDDPLPVSINLFPVEIFTGKGQPQNITCNLYYDDSEEEDPIVVV